MKSTNKLLHEDIIFLGELLRMGKSDEIISQCQKVLWQARQEGKEENPASILRSRPINSEEVTLARFTHAGSILLEKGLLSKEQIQEDKSAIFQMDAQQKDAVLFSLAALQEKYFGQEEANQILKKWSQDPKGYQKTNFPQYLLQKKFLEASQVGDIRQKYTSISLSNSGSVCFKEGVPQIQEYVPKSFGRYQIKREIARGGMGIVYEAYDPSFERDVALKVLLSGKENKIETARFLREARTVNRVEHPNIVPVYDLGEENDSPYFCMAYIKGMSLDKYSLPLSPRKCFKIIIPIAQALHEAHQNNIIHRDVKPANIIVDEEGKPWLTDFGLAKDQEGVQTLTQKGSFMGTPSYMSPQQINSPESVTHQSDIYSLGVVMYQLLTGKLPFEAKALTTLISKISLDDPTLPQEINPQIPDDVAKICLKAMAKKTSKRYQSALRLANDIEKSSSVSGRGSSPRSRSNRYSTVSTNSKSRNSSGASRNSRLNNIKQKQRKSDSSKTTLLTVAIVLSFVLFFVYISQKPISQLDKKEHKPKKKLVEKNTKAKESPETLENTEENSEETSEAHKARTPGPAALLKEEETASFHYLEAQKYVQQRNFTASLKELNKALLIDDKYLYVYELKGKILLEMAHYKRALSNFEKALKFFPQDPIFRSSKALALEKMRRYQEAVVAYTEAIQVRPCNHCYMKRGIIYCDKLGMYDAALEDFKRIQSIAPTYRSVYYNIHVAYRKKKAPEEAINYFTECIEQYPYPQAYLQRGIFWLEFVHDIEKAFADFEKANELNPNLYNVHYYISVGLAQQGKWEDALSAIDKAFQLKPSEAKLFLQRGEYYLQLGQKDRALAEWRRGLSLPSRYSAAFRAKINQWDN